MPSFFRPWSADPPSGDGGVRSSRRGSMTVSSMRLMRPHHDVAVARVVVVLRAAGRRREIQTSSFVEFGPMVPILVGHCNSKDRFNRLTAVQWVHEFIKLGVRTL